MRALMKSANYCVLSRPRSIVIAIKRNIFIYHRFINHGHVYNTSKLNGGRGTRDTIVALFRTM